MNAQDTARACTARVLLRRAGRDSFAGTAFFVDRGVLLTCSHVVAGRDGADVLIRWSGKDWPCTLLTEQPSPFPTAAGTTLSATLPDLAMLRCGASNDVALLLDPDDMTGQDAEFFLYGFSEEVDGEVAGHPLRCGLDGMVDVEPDWRLLKFASGRVLRGQSGCAILSERTGLVVGIAKRRIPGDAAACYGIPSDAIFRCLPDLAEPQRALRLEQQARESARRMLSLPAPNPFFSPRPEAMRALAASLQEGKVATLLGPAGVGKTALAREYVSQTLGHYAETLWLDARDEDTARRLLAGIAGDLGLPVAAGLSRLAGTVHAELDRTAGSWLLVLDGLADPKLGRALLPGGTAARVVITSRLPELRKLGARDPVRLAPLDPGQAAALVTARLAASTPPPAVAALVAQAQGQPGALEQGAASLLQGRAESGAWPDAPPDPDGRTAAALAAEPGGALLRRLALLADAPLPLIALAETPGDRRPWAAAEALTIASLAWTDPLAETITLDGQTRPAVLQRMDSEQQRRERLQAQVTLTNVFSRGDLALSRQLVPHALALLRDPRDAERRPVDLMLRTWTARTLMLSGDHVGAESVAGVVQDEIMGRGSRPYGTIATVDHLHLLAQLRIRMGQLNKVGPLLNRLDRILREDPPTPGVPADFAAFVLAESSLLRAELRRFQRQPDAALELLLPALAYFGHHPRGAARAARALEEVMSSLMAKRRIAAAVKLLPRLQEAVRGTPKASAGEAQIYLYLGIACIKTAGDSFPASMIQMRNAEQHLRHALAIAENGLPDPDETTASCCVNLGLVLQHSALGDGRDLEAAITFLRQAIDIRTRMYGAGSSRLRTAFYQLGLALTETGQAAEAEASLRRVVIGPQEEDSLTEQALEALATLYAAPEDAAKLQAVRERLESVRARQPPDPHPEPWPGESAAERNRAFIQTTLQLRGPPD